MLSLILAAFAIIAGGCACFCLYVLPNRLLRPKGKRWRIIAGEEQFSAAIREELRCEDMRVQTKDGVTIAGWFIPAASPATRTVVMLHGIGGSGARLLPEARLFRAHGFNVCLFDSRGSGESGGIYCTYGYYEKYDLIALIDALSGDAAGRTQEIGLLGFSMGAAVALQTAAIEPRVQCVIAEACFTDVSSAGYDYLERRLGVRWKWLHDTAIRAAERKAHFSVKDVSPVESVKKITIPVMFVHGSGDRIVKAEYSQILFDNCAGPKERMIIAGGAHTGLREIAGESYDCKRLDFFKRYL